MTIINEIDLQKNIAKWEIEKTLGQYARDHFAKPDSKDNKPKIAKVLDNIYKLSLSSESEQVQLQAAREIRETIALGESKEKTENLQVNFYSNANNLINENSQKLIAASPKKVTKTGIEGII